MALETEQALVEAVLLMETEPIDEKTISRVTGLGAEVVRRALSALVDRYAVPECGLELRRIADGLLLAPKEVLSRNLRDRYGKRHDTRLSKAALETLSIIAYSQPVTRGEIESLRGVAADGMIRLLLDRGFIKETGKKDAPGRPTQYGTSREFLRAFRLSSISDLPKLEDVEEERFAPDE